MRRSVREAIVGFTLLAALAGGGGLWLWLQGVSAGNRSWRFAVRFSDATGLGDRSAVTYRGVQVGHVRQLHTSTDAVVAELEITDPNLRLAMPMVPQVEESSLLGGDAVVALLAVELIEVLALQLIDGMQSLVRSRRWPGRIRSLRSHQSVERETREVVELARIWAPLLLTRVAPRLAPELQGVLGHALQQSLQNSMVPPPLRQLQPLLQVEQGLSRQLAAGMVDSLIDLTRSTGQRLGQRDDQQLQLLQACVDRFWEELADALEQGPALEESQRLIAALLEDIKRTYVSQISRAGIEELIDELDLLMVRPQESATQSTPPAGSP